ncbi:MAG TPA: hypothetical protein VKD89_06330 [Candidatus Udaeobacter sp.]|nr:hypothetical protein [Candidatus Udaeobacter sp.]
MDVNEAKIVAFNFLTQIYPTIRIEDARLEEVEISDDEQYWTVTLSFTEGSGTILSRNYKRFRIRAEDGKVMSMTIRKP